MMLGVQKHEFNCTATRMAKTVRASFPSYGYINFAELEVYELWD